MDFCPKMQKEFKMIKIIWINWLKECRTMACDIFLRNNNGKWLMVVNLEKSLSMKNCSMVKKILKILYTCLKIKVYYVFLFLKVSQCKLKQKETILKLGNPLKSKSNSPNQKSAWVLPPPPPTRALDWTHWGPSDSRPNFLSVYNSKISPPYQNL